jgi:hypothetical protein
MTAENTLDDKPRRRRRKKKAPEPQTALERRLAVQADSRRRKVGVPHVTTANPHTRALMIRHANRRSSFGALGTPLILTPKMRTRGGAKSRRRRARMWEAR